MKVKFADLSVVHNFLRKKFISAFKTSLKNSDFIGGKNVSKFEKNFAKINNSKFCISVANGTDALFVSLKTLGIKKNDEVIVPAHSWISEVSKTPQSQRSLRVISGRQARSRGAR